MLWVFCAISRRTSSTEKTGCNLKFQLQVASNMLQLKDNSPIHAVFIPEKSGFSYVTAE